MTHVISSIIVKVVPETAEEISRQLGKIPNVETHGVYKEEHIVIVAEGHDVPQLENLIDYISTNFPEVIGVYPTYVNWEGEEENLEPDNPQ